jgi:polysaccharide biosynthesis transport protein
LDSPETAPQNTLRHYIRVIGRRKWIVVAAIVLTLVSVLGLSAVQDPVYRATAEVLVQQRMTDQLFQQQAPQQVGKAVETEIRVLKSRPVRERVEKELGAVPAIKAKHIPDTDIFQVMADRTNKKDAVAIVDSYVGNYMKLRREQVVQELELAGREIQGKVNQLQQQIDELSEGLSDVLPEGCTSRDPQACAELRNVESGIAGRRNALIDQQALFRERLDQLQVDASLRTGGVQLVTPAELEENPVAPKPLRNGVLGGLVGIVLGLAFAFLIDYFDDSIKNKEDFERAAGGLKVIGVIPSVSGWKNRTETQVVSLQDPSSPAAESYRTLRTSISFLNLDRPLRLIQVTSPTSGDGKTTTSSNLAVALTRAGQRVIMVDCDLRRPRLHDFFGADNAVGFTSVLLGDAPLTNALQAANDNERLWVLPSGPVPPNPSELLASARAREVFEALRAQADVVIVDTPPVLPVTDPAVLSAMVDGVLIVSTAGQTTRHEVSRAVEILRQVDAPLIGAVLNNVGTDGEYGGYGYRSQYYSVRQPEPAANGGRGKGKARRNGKKAKAQAGV